MPTRGFEVPTPGEPAREFSIQKLPRIVRVHLFICVALSVPSFIAGLALADTVRVVVELIWIGLFAFFYLNFAHGKNWSRIALIVLTFPIGLMLLGSQARLYCLRSKV
jgi:hypothetical protein